MRKTPLIVESVVDSAVLALRKQRDAELVARKAAADYAVVALKAQKERELAKKKAAADSAVLAFRAKKDSARVARQVERDAKKAAADSAALALRVQRKRTSAERKEAQKAAADYAALALRAQRERTSAESRAKKDAKKAAKKAAVVSAALVLRVQREFVLSERRAAKKVAERLATEAKRIEKVKAHIAYVSKAPKKVVVKPILNNLDWVGNTLLLPTYESLLHGDELTDEEKLLRREYYRGHAERLRFANDLVSEVISSDSVTLLGEMGVEDQGDIFLLL